MSTRSKTPSASSGKRAGPSGSVKAAKSAKAAKKATPKASKRDRELVFSKPNPHYLQLHIQILDIHPPIWRRIIIPEDRDFLDLHNVLQKIMPWQGSHMHCFHVTDPTTGEEHDVGPRDIDPELIGERHTWLERYLAGVGSQCVYEYDMGDSWEHLIEVEQVFDNNPNPGGAMVRVLGGARAAPPENSGGIGGYEDLLEKLADPNHEEHLEIVEWLESCGYENYDPEAFDLVEANDGLP